MRFKLVINNNGALYYTSRERHVTENDIMYFIMKKRNEGISEKMIRDEIHYIRKVLAEMD